eukprot:7029411-Pyramimonas_sp.AAC.1
MDRLLVTSKPRATVGVPPFQCTHHTASLRRFRCISRPHVHRRNTISCKATEDRKKSSPEAQDTSKFSWKFDEESYVNPAYAVIARFLPNKKRTKTEDSNPSPVLRRDAPKLKVSPLRSELEEQADRVITALLPR